MERPENHQVSTEGVHESLIEQGVRFILYVFTYFP